MVYPNCPNGAQQFTCQDNNRFIVFFFLEKSSLLSFAFCRMKTFNKTKDGLTYDILKGLY